jgi:hypothetical protein
MCCTAAGKEASFRVVDVSSGQFLHGRPASCVSNVAQISSTVLSAPCLSLPRGVALQSSPRLRSGCASNRILCPRYGHACVIVQPSCLLLESELQVECSAWDVHKR